MSSFHESQLEQAFVELFQKEGYDYVYGECILRDTRDVILYDDLRFYLRKKYKTDHITEDEINAHLTGGSNFTGSKSRIYAFYQTPHTAKEKLDFLKNEYGTGGGNNALSHNFMSHVWTDGKGICYDKPTLPTTIPFFSV